MTTAMAKAIQALYEKLKTETVPDIRSRYAITVLDLIFKRPVITAAHVQLAIHASSKVTAYNLINKFVKADILRHYLTISKEKYFVFSDLHKIIRG